MSQSFSVILFLLIDFVIGNGSELFRKIFPKVDIDQLNVQSFSDQHLGQGETEE